MILSTFSDASDASSWSNRVLTNWIITLNLFSNDMSQYLWKASSEYLFHHSAESESIIHIFFSSDFCIFHVKCSFLIKYSWDSILYRFFLTNAFWIVISFFFWVRSSRILKRWMQAYLYVIEFNLTETCFSTSSHFSETFWASIYVDRISLNSMSSFWTYRVNWISSSKSIFFQTSFLSFHITFITLFSRFSCSFNHSIDWFLLYLSLINKIAILIARF